MIWLRPRSQSDFGALNGVHLVLPLLPLCPPYAFFAQPMFIPDLHGTPAITGVESWACFGYLENHYSSPFVPKFPYPQSVALRAKNFPTNGEQYIYQPSTLQNDWRACIANKWQTRHYKTSKYVKTGQLNMREKRNGNALRYFHIFTFRKWSILQHYIQHLKHPCNIEI
jgi:hypothetical protein